jgi:hypothetical protein
MHKGVDQRMVWENSRTERLDLIAIWFGKKRDRAPILQKIAAPILQKGINFRFGFDRVTRTVRLPVLNKAVHTFLSDALTCVLRRTGACARFVNFPISGFCEVLKEMFVGPSNFNQRRFRVIGKILQGDSAFPRTPVIEIGAFSHFVGTHVNPAGVLKLCDSLRDLCFCLGFKVALEVFGNESAHRTRVRLFTLEASRQ